MARALARGWGDPVLATDAGSGRAAQLAEELGGEAAATNSALAEQADIVVLCHKPAQLAEVARDIAGRARVVASVLAGVTLADLREAYGDTPVFRLMPNTPVEVRQGVTVLARDPQVDPAVQAEVVDLFERLGTVFDVAEAQMDVAMALMGCAPAYLALVAEAQVEAAAARGMDADTAARLVVETMGGTAALLRARDHDAAAVQREVASPGGYTEQGLHALQEAGVPEALQTAMDVVTAPRRA
ncbi:MAG: pyrroline-5-carboxylate reductase [Solirubrobacteraceae bacterium]|nr:pyrroline-5-carboxylate reductase [Solirubrobacteraceae bacterium]